MFSSNLKTLLVTRYLILLAHLVLVLTILMSRDVNVKAGLPSEFTIAEYESQDKDFFVDLMLSSGCLIGELIIFCTGLTMFRQFTTCFSILVHAIGTITLSYFVLEEVDSYYFWWIFGFGSCAPISLDLLNLLFNQCFRDSLN